MFRPTPFLMDFARIGGFRKTHFSILRPSVRPSGQTPIALESVDFASPKMTLPSVRAFFCEIRNSHISPAASPQRGLTSNCLLLLHVREGESRSKRGPVFERRGGRDEAGRKW